MDLFPPRPDRLFGESFISRLFLIRPPSHFLFLLEYPFAFPKAQVVFVGVVCFFFGFLCFGCFFFFGLFLCFFFFSCDVFAGPSLTGLIPPSFLEYLPIGTLPKSGGSPVPGLGVIPRGRVSPFMPPLHSSSAGSEKSISSSF